MDNEILKFIINNGFVILLVFMILEKIVKLSPAKWDDIIVDGLKDMWKALKKIKPV